MSCYSYSCFICFIGNWHVMVVIRNHSTQLQVRGFFVFTWCVYIQGLPWERVSSLFHTKFVYNPREMENFQTLASESFSSNWLVNKSRSSLVCVTSSSLDFDFDIELPTSSYTLIDANEIFFDGKMVPSFAHHSYSKALSCPSTPIICMHSSSKTHDSIAYPKHNITILKRWKHSSKILLKKLFRILSSDFSNENPREISTLHSCPRKISFDVEDSIYEAIVHCKRSFGTQMKWYLFILSIKLLLKIPLIHKNGHG